MERIELIGKPGCHLCEDALAVISRVAAELGVGWVERSILADADLFTRFAEQIPVTIVDGRVIAIFHIDEHQLREALG